VFSSEHDRTLNKIKISPEPTPNKVKKKVSMAPDVVEIKPVSDLADGLTK